jgi:hypothetical protein
VKIVSGIRVGKTVELIKQSNREWKYIVCADENRALMIMKTAKWLKLDIPFPITVRELPIRTQHIKSVLLDDVEAVLWQMIRKDIDIATTRCEVEKLIKEEIK